MMLLNSVDSLLEHIEEVQKDVINLSGESLLKMSTYIEKHEIDVDDDISTALQYQDIITQQLNASIEAIESIKNSMQSFEANNDSQILQEKLNNILQDAKDKKSRFSGKTAEHDASTETIEFF